MRRRGHLRIRHKETEPATDENSRETAAHPALALAELVVVHPRLPDCVLEPIHARSRRDAANKLRRDLAPLCICVARFPRERRRGSTEASALVRMINKLPLTVDFKQVSCTCFETGFSSAVPSRKRNDWWVSTAVTEGFQTCYFPGVGGLAQGTAVKR